jgi:formate hydrogenlyase subunit 4
MIHEAMLLEYSGPELACASAAAQVKQTVLLSMLACVFFPAGLAPSAVAADLAVAIPVFAGKLIGLALVIAVVESSIAKLRLFRIPDFIGVAVGLALLAVVAREAL